MKLLRVGPVGEERPAALGADGAIWDLSGLGRDIDGDFFTDDGIAKARAALASGSLPSVAIDGLRIGAPIARPEKIVGIGVNYRDHAEETGARPPDEPVVFLKAPNCVVGPNDDISIPRNSQKTDWEIELAVVIGARARYLDSPDKSRSVVAGYTISNDVSEREFQLERGGQWTKGKSCETFNPLGPWLVTPDEVPDPQSIGLRLWVNGVLRQHGSTRDMIFGVEHLVWYVSQFMVLEPGDIINTGTPAGVALGDPELAFLREGDVVELEADGLGRQRCRLVSA
ncbi:MAG TPA: fumarylacetoacetate hydrolase family protein [Acidimicrobiales bacterium]|nr:fumarylacetoacetate hydrolase family protein [Acidimicrobiales bacterium]